MEELAAQQIAVATLSLLVEEMGGIIEVRQEDVLRHLDQDNQGGLSIALNGELIRLENVEAPSDSQV